MQQKKWLAGALGCILACSHPAGLLAAEIPQTQTIEITQETAAVQDGSVQLPEGPVRMPSPS